MLSLKQNQKTSLNLKFCFPFQVQQPPEINLVLRPQGLTGDNEVYAKVDLWVKCPHTYPDT